MLRENDKYFYQKMKRTCALILLTILLPVGASNSFAGNIDLTAFGDSLTVGYPYYRDEAWGAQPFGMYPPRLEQRFANNCQDTARVYNWGYSGRNSSQLAGLAPGVVAATPSSVAVLIWSGANDLYHGINSITSVYFNLSSIISTVQNSGKHAVVSTITPNNYGPYNDAIVYDYNPKIRDLVNTRGATLADQYQMIIGDWNSLNIDGLHMNEEGYSEVAKKWFDTIKGFYCTAKPVEPPPTPPASYLAPAIYLLKKKNP